MRETVFETGEAARGMLADGEGRVIDFKNTVIFLTTNHAAEAILELCAHGRRPPAALASYMSAID